MRLGELRIGPEVAILTVSCALWVLAILGQFGVLDTAGLLALDLYSLYALAGALGWIAGNVYVLRQRQLGGGTRLRRRLLLAYLLGPPSVVYLVRTFAPAAWQAAAPLVPWYAFAVYGIFFLVPVTLKGSWSRSRER